MVVCPECHDLSRFGPAALPVNRLHSSDVGQIRADQLPPASPAGPVRMLFINSNILGIKTQAASLREATQHLPNIDAVHIDIERSLVVKLLTGSYRLPSGIDLPYFRYLQAYRWIIGRWLRGPLDSSRFDVVHFLTQGVAGCVLDMPPGPRPAFVTNVDSTAKADVDEFKIGSLTQQPYIAAERRIFERVDRIACWSRWAARSVASDYGIPASKVLTAVNAVTIPDRQASHSHEGLPRIVFVGNDWKRKGGEDLLAIHQRHFADTAELHIVSSASRPRGHLTNVIWHGRVDRHVLTTELLPTMDLFVLPTRMDMAPWVVLEAAAAGLPVIATRLAAIPEMVLDNESGILPLRGSMDAFAQAMDTLLRSPSMRIRMGQRGREHIRANYNAAVVYRDYLDTLVALGLERRGAR